MGTQSCGPKMGNANNIIAVNGHVDNGRNTKVAARDRNGRPCGKRKAYTNKNNLRTGD